MSTDKLQLVWFHTIEVKDITVPLRVTLPYLVALVSFIGGPSRRVREDVGLGMLVGPEFLLSCLQHHGGLHHVLLFLVLIEAGPQHAGVKTVFVSVKGKKPQQFDFVLLSRTRTCPTASWHQVRNPFNTNKTVSRCITD